jgi:Tfp pilus assembly pilus retraction ATPase PilT
MIGEIRDTETAEIAVEAALTGPLPICEVLPLSYFISKPLKV